MLEKIKEHRILVLIIGMALLFRVLGFWHGFPFIFHPDEPSVIRSALGIRFNSNPEHFDWPHLHFYLNYILYMIFVKFRGLLAALPYLETIRDGVLFRDPIIFYMLGRIFNGFLGALTVIPIFLAGRVLAGKRAGLIAALAFALMPLHVRVSHFALIDVPMIFWMSWGVYFSYKVLKSPQYKNYIFAGLFFGLAMSTKYNGLVGVLALVISHLLVSYRNFNAKNFVLKPISSILACTLGFLIGTPYALFDFETFSRTDGPKGALWQFKNVGSVGLIRQIQHIFTQSSPSLLSGTGYAIFVLYVATVLAFLKNILAKQNVSSFLLTTVPALAIIFNVAGFSRQQAHYYLPAYPFIALAVGVYLTQLDLGKLKKYAIVSIFILPLLFSLYQVVILSLTDTRVIAYNESSKILKSNDIVLYNSNDFDPLIEKFKKAHETEEASTFKEAQKYKNGVWIIRQQNNKELIDYPLAKHITNSFRNGPEIYIYYLQ
jgi:hypothetical protein